jgi:hypothetical protein
MTSPHSESLEVHPFWMVPAPTGTVIIGRVNIH